MCKRIEEFNEKYNYRNTFSSPDNLILFLEKLPENFIYRGAHNSTYRLVPSIYRNIDCDYLEYLGYLNANENHDDLLKFLYFYVEEEKRFEAYCYAQHFGAKTKLLDFSSDPLIGLLFACQNFGEENVDETDGILYVVDSYKIPNLSLNDETTLVDFLYEGEGYGVSVSYILKDGTENKADLSKIQFLNPSDFDIDIGGHPLNRLKNQKGCFLIFPKLEANIFEFSIDECDYVFVIPHDDKQIILDKLKEKGITMTKMKACTIN